jgi:hypothetical protein
MILLYPVVQVHVRPMLYLISHDFAYSTWIGTMPIRCDVLWSMTNHCKGLLEELLGGIHITLFTQPYVNEIAVMVNSSIKITPFPMDLDVGLIHVPGSASLASSFCTQLVRKQRCKSGFPLPYRLMSERPPMLQKHLCHISKAELIAQSPEMTRRTISVGYSRKLKGVPVRSLKRCLQAAQRNVRYPRMVFLFCSFAQ